MKRKINLKKGKTLKVKQLYFNLNKPKKHNTLNERSYRGSNRIMFKDCFLNKCINENFVSVNGSYVMM